VIEKLVVAGLALGPFDECVRPVRKADRVRFKDIIVGVLPLALPRTLPRYAKFRCRG
jgi:hypothetical protein